PANAGDFCRRDVTGHMTGCGFDNMAQCQAASSGLGGDCFADPFKNNNQSTQNNSGNALNSGRNAFAYQPKSSRTRIRHAPPNAGSPANSDESRVCADGVGADPALMSGPAADSSARGLAVMSPR